MSSGGVVANTRAQEIALFGRELSGVEPFVQSLHDLRQLVEMIKEKDPMEKAKTVYYEGLKKGRKMTVLEGVRRELRKCEENLFGLFIEAVEKGNAVKILEIAEAAQFIKQSRHYQADKQLWLLIYLKRRLEVYGDTMTVREVAEVLNIPKTQDGYSALRRKCKEISFPLTLSRKTARK